MSWGFRKSAKAEPGVRATAGKRWPGIGFGWFGLRARFFRKRL
jgi:hypothetical protein